MINCIIVRSPIKQLKRFSFTALCIMGYVNAAEFNPESAQFSRMETIKEWVAPRHHANKSLMLNVQREIAKATPENPLSYQCVEPVQADPGQSRVFGKSMPHFPHIEIPCLKEIHQRSLLKHPKVVEFACGNGKFSWTIPLTFENNGDLWINDIGSIMVTKAMDRVQRMLPQDLFDMVHPVPGSCLDFVEKNPMLTNQIDVISCSNLQHFINPEEDQKLLKNCGELLTKGGMIFFMANTITTGSDRKGEKMFDRYIELKKQGVPYPGFMKTIILYTLDRVTQLAMQTPNISAAIEVPTNTPCGSKNSNISYGYYFHNNQLKENVTLTQECVGQFFTPSIYKNAVALHNKTNEKSGNHLTVVDAFLWIAKINDLQNIKRINI